MSQDFIFALIGGAVIGLASGLLLILNGRIAGISGIVGGVLLPKDGDRSWRASFVAGLIVGGVVLLFVRPATFPTADSPRLLLVIAGLLVGFGTRLGSGCTSGHGVCGIPRLSARSWIATCTFIVAGAITVWVQNL